MASLYLAVPLYNKWVTRGRIPATNDHNTDSGSREQRAVYMGRTREAPSRQASNGTQGENGAIRFEYMIVGTKWSGVFEYILLRN